MNIGLEKIVSLLVSLSFVVALISCETIEEQYEERPGATVGAGVGAAVGAIAGSQIGDSTTSTVIGGLLGALAGAAIGHYAYDKNRERDETAEAIGYDPSQGIVLDVQNVTATPETVSPGETVNLRATYAVVAPDPNQTVQVREVRKIYHNGQLVGSPEVTVARTGGTYTATVPLTLPSTAAQGVYTVETVVESGTVQDTGQSTFTVG